MKTKYLFFAASALLVFASCSNDDFASEKSQTLVSQPGDGSIQFGFDMQNATRADKVAGDAANLLQSQFIVYGTKHASAEAADASNDAAVFTNYKVEYTANTAGTQLSNTHNWEYVGLTPYAAEKVSPAATSQTVKFWDYSAENGYTFYGIASKADITNGHVKVTKTTTGTTIYDKGYSVQIDKDANLGNLYVADREPVAKTNFGKPVTLTFRNFGTRVRVGFYETIPGYSVKIDKFYYDNDAAVAVTSFANMTDANATNFAVSLQNISNTPMSGTDPSTNTITVSYFNGTDGPANQVKLAPTTVDYDYTLELGTGIISAEKLATSAANPTWDKAGGAYTTVIPFGASNPLLMKVDYTLTAEDGGGEVIHVLGANVVVPTQYVQWKSNYAYTYLFKISDNTNGTTDGTVQGLYPITFDAVVVAVEDGRTQETITTFEDYSVTTYANGSKVTTNNEYKAGEDIYVVKTDNSTGAVVAPTAIGTAANNVQVYTATTTGDAISEATIKANLTGSPNGITLTAAAPAATLVEDGIVPAAEDPDYNFGANGAVKFTPAAAGTYVYVYTRTPYVAPTYAAASDTFLSTETYYFVTTAGVYYAAEGINADNFDTYKANLYKKTADGTAGEYDIKIIKVAAGS